MNAYYETGFANPIDEAIRSYRKFDLTGHSKLGEEPYDFIRKRLSILVSKPSKTDQGDGRCILVTKGALQNVLSVCTQAETTGDKTVDISEVHQSLQKLYEDYSSKGYRTLGIAYKIIESESLIVKTHESDMIFLGFLTLFDPPKQDIVKTINSLKNLGISLKIITGDNRLIAANVMQQLGLSDVQILTGSELRQVSDAALLKRVSNDGLS